MVEIKEFQALIYNKEKLDKLKIDFKDVICPPYDVISPAYHKSLLYKKFNFVNLELPKGTGNKRYQNAKKTLTSWKRTKVIIEDNFPSIYVYQQKFSFPSGTQNFYTRLGMFCLVKADFEYKNILPHEHTNPKPLEDRKKLLNILNVQTSSPFFLLEDDNKDFYNTLLKLLKPQYLFFVAKEDNGDEHRIYRISDPKIISTIKKLLNPKKLYIADGHHRYKVTCEYLKENKNEYLMGYICSLSDEGLLILPTHRAFAGSHIIEEIKKYFDFVDWDGKDSLGILFYNKGTFKVLKPKVSLKQLPKLVATQPYFVFDKIISDLEGEQVRQHIFYHPDMKEVISYADRYNGCAFIMPSVKKEEFAKIVNNRIIFPPKTTYFYPKVFCGFVFYKI